MNDAFRGPDRSDPSCESLALTFSLWHHPRKRGRSASGIVVRDRRSTKKGEAVLTVESLNTSFGEKEPMQWGCVLCCVVMVVVRATARPGGRGPHRCRPVASGYAGVVSGTLLAQTDAGWDDLPWNVGRVPQGCDAKLTGNRSVWVVLLRRGERLFVYVPLCRSRRVGGCVHEPRIAVCLRKISFARPLLQPLGNRKRWGKDGVPRPIGVAAARRWREVGVT
mmetsp:Transcript_44447/g.137191  ORF Transcript_44447/g.137191 Transcript_44447/m.137191 type:complete len:222 (-) Transcript_44447:1268-1933(-)